MDGRFRASEARKRVLFETLETARSAREERNVVLELRSERRFDTDFAGTVCTEHGYRADVRVGNVSRSGLMLSGDLRGLLATLNWRGPGPQFKVTLQVSFYIPAGFDRELFVEARCQTAYARRIAPDEYQIGLKIREFEEGRTGYIDYVWRRQSDT